MGIITVYMHVVSEEPTTVHVLSTTPTANTIIITTITTITSTVTVSVMPSDVAAGVCTSDSSSAVVYTSQVHYVNKRTFVQSLWRLANHYIFEKLITSGI